MPIKKKYTSINNFWAKYFYTNCTSKTVVNVRLQTKSTICANIFAPFAGTLLYWRESVAEL
jgi:hypothetical protein